MDYATVDGDDEAHNYEIHINIVFAADIVILNSFQYFPMFEGFDAFAK